MVYTITTTFLASQAQVDTASAAFDDPTLTRAKLRTAMDRDGTNKIVRIERVTP